MRVVDEVEIDGQVRECIQRVSNIYRYQNRLLLFFILTGLFCTMQVFSGAFFFINPLFTCAGSDSRVAEDAACLQIDQCTPIEPETLTAQLHIYCTRKHDRTIIQTGMAFGCWASLVVSGLGDRTGKRVLLCGSLLLLNLSCALTFLGAHTGELWLFLASYVICGFSNKAVYICFITLLTRFLSRDHYETGTVLFMVAYHGLSHLAIASLNYFFHDWTAVAYTYSAAILLSSLAAFFILKEDPLFLFETGKFTQVKRIIEEIGHENGANRAEISSSLMRIDEIFEAKMSSIESQTSGGGHYDLREVLRWDVVKTALIIGTAGCFYQMALASIEFSIEGLESSYTFNIFLIGIANFCGYGSAIYVLRAEPQRKRGLIVSSLLYGLLVHLFLFPFCADALVQTVLIFALRVLLSWSCTFYMRLKVDSFPEKYQMTIIAAIEFIVTLGDLSAPTIVQASIDRGLNPLVTVGLARLLLGALPVFLLVEQKIHLVHPRVDSDCPDA